MHFCVQWMEIRKYKAVSIFLLKKKLTQTETQQPDFYTFVRDVLAIIKGTLSFLQCNLIIMPFGKNMCQLMKSGSSHCLFLEVPSVFTNKFYRTCTDTEIWVCIMYTLYSCWRIIHALLHKRRYHGTIIVCMCSNSVRCT